MAQHTAVVTDSASCLPALVASDWNISVVPLHVVIDGKSRREGDPGLADDVVTALRSGAAVSTSQPSIAECVQVLDDALTRAESVVAVTLSSAISGTFSAMEAAAAQVGGDVTVIDSRTVAMGHGFAALSAAAAAKAGASSADVAQEAMDVARSAMCLFTVETLNHLRQGGRISPAVAALGQALGIRPVLGVLSGEVQAIDRVRTAAKARATMLDRIVSRAPTMRRPVVSVVTLPGDESVAATAGESLHLRGTWPVAHAPLSAVLAAHAGPGALAAVVADVRPEIVEYFSD